VVAASTAPNVGSVAFAAPAEANDNSSDWGDFEKSLDMLLAEELEMLKEKDNDSMYFVCQELRVMNGQRGTNCGRIWEPQRTKFNVQYCSTLKHVYTKKQKR